MSGSNSRGLAREEESPTHTPKLLLGRLWSHETTSEKLRWTHLGFQCRPCRFCHLLETIALMKYTQGYVVPGMVHFKAQLWGEVSFAHIPCTLRGLGSLYLYLHMLSVTSMVTVTRSGFPFGLLTLLTSVTAALALATLRCSRGILILDSPCSSAVLCPVFSSGSSWHLPQSEVLR